MKGYHFNKITKIRFLFAGILSVLYSQLLEFHEECFHVREVNKDKK